MDHAVTFQRTEQKVQVHSKHQDKAQSGWVSAETCPQNCSKRKGEARLDAVRRMKLWGRLVFTVTKNGKKVHQNKPWDLVDCNGEGADRTTLENEYRRAFGTGWEFRWR